jgi:hypothetical protein
MADPFVFEVPLSPSPQVFSIDLNGTSYRLTFTYRDTAMGGWMMDVATDAGTPLACGLPLVTGANLLGQFEYLNMNGAMVVVTDGDETAIPTFFNLGIQSRLLWVSKPE